MSDLKLLSVDISYNLFDPGDKIYITTKWQNNGVKPRFNAQIATDFIFCGRHRRDETQTDIFKTSWYPVPAVFQWEQGEVWTTTGVWNVPSTWGGSFAVNISLVDEKGKNVEFIGKNGIKTASQFISEIDIGWTYGRNQLLQQRIPIHIDFNKETNYNLLNEIKTVCFQGYKFNEDYPAVCGFEKDNWYDFAPVLTLRKISDNSKLIFIGNEGIKYEITKNKNNIIYSASNQYCKFDVLILYKKTHLEIDLENIAVKEDYELISFEIPSLVQMNNEETEFTNFYGGGRRIRLKNALYQSKNFHYDVCNMVAASSNSGSFCLEATDVDNIIKQSVIKRGNEAKTVSIGATIRACIKADKEGMKSIPVSLKPLKLWYKKENDWKMAAEIIKETFIGNYPHIYENTLMYKIMLDASGQYEEDNPSRWVFAKITTLKDVKKMIMNMYHLSQGMHQVVYLIGWQSGGHDLSYPYPYKFPFNPNCGTIEEFNALREELKEYNVELSLHDNFDDAYLSKKYQLNPEIISHDEKGNPWKGWMWAGGMSYIVDPKAYVLSGEMVERVEYVTKDYGIENTYHLDVLTSEMRRYNFNDKYLTCANEGIDYKIKMIEAFNKKGIDITSETLSMPFVGKIGYAQNTRYNTSNVLFFGEEVAPLTTIAFHGITPYKTGSNGSKESIFKTIAFGASCCIEVECETSEVLNARNLYLSSIPMSKLAYMRVVDAKSENGIWEIEYENGKVYADFNSKNYRIELDGKIVSENYTSFISLKDNEYIYFSMKGGEVKLELPEDWEKALVSEIGENGIKSEFVILKDKAFVLNAKPDVPYKLTKGI